MQVQKTLVGPQGNRVCLDLLPDPGDHLQVCPGEDAAEADEGDGGAPEDKGAGEGEGACFPEPGLPQSPDEGRYLGAWGQDPLRLGRCLGQPLDERGFSHSS